MNTTTEEAKASALYGKARDQLRGFDTMPWHDLHEATRTLLTRFLRLAVMEALQGGNAIRRDVLQHWGAAAQRATNGKTGVAVVVDVMPDGLEVTAYGPTEGQASLLVPYADIIGALTPKGAIDEIISHLLAQVRPAGEGITFNGGH